MSFSYSDIFSGPSSFPPEHSFKDTDLVHGVSWTDSGSIGGAFPVWGASSATTTSQQGKNAVIMSNNNTNIPEIQGWSHDDSGVGGNDLSFSIGLWIENYQDFGISPRLFGVSNTGLFNADDLFSQEAYFLFCNGSAPLAGANWNGYWYDGFAGIFDNFTPCEFTDVQNASGTPVLLIRNGATNEITVRMGGNTATWPSSYPVPFGGPPIIINRLFFGATTGVQQTAGYTFTDVQIWKKALTPTEQDNFFTAYNGKYLGAPPMGAITLAETSVNNSVLTVQGTWGGGIPPVAPPFDVLAIDIQTDTPITLPSGLIGSLVARFDTTGANINVWSNVDTFTTSLLPGGFGLRVQVANFTVDPALNTQLQSNQSFELIWTGVANNDFADWIGKNINGLRIEYTSHPGPLVAIGNDFWGTVYPISGVVSETNPPTAPPAFTSNFGANVKDRNMAWGRVGWQNANVATTFSTPGDAGLTHVLQGGGIGFSQGNLMENPFTDTQRIGLRNVSGKSIRGSVQYNVRTAPTSQNLRLRVLVYVNFGGSDITLSGTQSTIHLQNMVNGQGSASGQVKIILNNNDYVYLMVVNEDSTDPVTFESGSFTVDEASKE